MNILQDVIWQTFFGLFLTGTLQLQQSKHKHAFTKTRHNRFIFYEQMNIGIVFYEMWCIIWYKKCTRDAVCDTITVTEALTLSGRCTQYDKCYTK